MRGNDMEFRVIGRSGDFDLFGLCHSNGYLVIKNSPQDFSEIFKYEGFQKAIKILKPTKIAIEQTTKRQWFIRLMVNNVAELAQ
jgi:hypothetical protein